MVSLSKERRDGIAYLVLKYQHQSERFGDPGPPFVLTVVNACGEMGIPRGEALQFVDEILKDDMRELFAQFDAQREKGVLCDGDEKL